MDVYVQQTYVYVQKGRARSNQIDVFARGQPILAEQMCLFGERICLVETVAPIPTEQMCLFGMVASIPIE